MLTEYLNAEERVVREEYYRIEVEIEIHWRKRSRETQVESSSNPDDDLTDVKISQRK